ncbi:DUF7344 domain-containing protein [Haloarchaeobius sp. DFWS5]|uniref:DUF7344 domain-containing protein n=1 Tax=Haloarchaeobius sp. DFWS5 TaxID=3446114 RepID=UPI003EBF69E4
MATKQVNQISTTKPTETGPTKEELFEVLSNRRRRQTLEYLLDCEDGASTKREISRQIAAWETDQPLELVSSDERKRVYIALHQTHLPKLDDAGLVEYESAQGTIQLTDACDGLEVYLDTDDEPETPTCWGSRYVCIGIGALAVTALAAVGALPVSGFALSALLAASLTTAGAAQVYSENHDNVEEIAADLNGRAS